MAPKDYERTILGSWIAAQNEVDSTNSTLCLALTFFIHVFELLLVTFG